LGTYHGEIILDTHDPKELVDITSQVGDAVRESGLKDGICLVWSTHTTASIVVNENERGLSTDIIGKVAEDFPRRGTWLHNLIDDNAHSHLAGTYLGPSMTIPIRNGTLSLGTYQSVFFLELDGPRNGRRVVVEIVGE